MSLLNISTFGPNDTVHVIVESPRGSSLKLKYDCERAVFGLSRPLMTGLTFPYDWGFVPSTFGPDGDPMDAMIFWDQTSYPGLLLACRLVGVLAVEQNSKRRPGTRERNDRVIAVPSAAPRCETIRGLGDVPLRVRQELESFFVASTAFEGKDLKLLGWSDASAALETIRIACSPAR